MAGAKNRAIRKLEKQITKTQRQITQAQRKKGRRDGFVGGVLLGTVAGGVLTYYLAQRSTEDAWESAPDGGDALLQREQPTPTGQTATVKPLPTLDVATMDKGPEEAVAATNLESPEAVKDIKVEAQTQEASPAQPTKQTQPVQQGAKQEQPAKQDQSMKQETQQEQPAAQPTGQEQPAGEAPESEHGPAPLVSPQSAPLPVEVERPEVVLARESGQSAEEIEEEATLAEAQQKLTMRAEPVDGTCPASHPIKGNRGSMGALIYHVPGGRNYDRTKPEACFATEADAQAAGYRAPRG